MSTAIATRYSSTDWFLFHKLCNIKRQNLPYWNCNTDFVTRLVGEASSTSTNPNIFLVRLCCSQHETDEEVILSRQTNSLVINQTLLMPHQDEPNSLVINQRVWFVLFVVNQSHRHIWRLDLSCCYPPSYLTAWSVLFVIHQFLLIITIAFKRGKQHQCRYIRFNGGLLCHFNPLKAVLSDCSHCFQKNWAHQCRCIRNNAGLLCRLISWKQCQSFMSPFPVWRKQYSMIIT